MTVAADRLVDRERGLKRQLTRRHMTMIAMGGAIGTGLFLGSGMAVGQAGPGVILAYIAGVGLCLIMMYALAEMAVVHPTAGSFGVYAETYLNPYAGFVVRYTYWFAQVVAVGGEVTAAGIYTRFWFPGTPLWIWVLLYSTVLVLVNLTAVRLFGEFEYWFAMIKVSAIVLFVVLGVAYVFGTVGGAAPIGWRNLLNPATGGFLPHGLGGVAKAMLVVAFSFYGIEIVAVTAGEALDPEREVPRALRSMVVRLGLFYIAAMALVVAIVPWPQAGLAESPFVTVFRSLGVPSAAGLMNFVVLTAALSSMNTNLYLAGRMLFSLGRSGFAPATFGHLSPAGAPRAAILTSALGLALAALLAARFSGSAYQWLFGIAIFGGILVWIVVLVTLIAFRRTRARQGLAPGRIRMPFYPWLPVAGIIALVLILIDCFFVGLAVAWLAGAIWIAFISLAYFARRRRPA
ncbi:MAG: amino acid permease [Bacteroidales bacterium]